MTELPLRPLHRVLALLDPLFGRQPVCIVLAIVNDIIILPDDAGDSRIRVILVGEVRQSRAVAVLYLVRVPSRTVTEIRSRVIPEKGDRMALS